MSQQYLSEFYTYKPLPPARVLVDRLPGADDNRVGDAGTPLEKRIQDLVLAGNGAFVRRRYAEALDLYLQAWGLLPRLIHPFFPEYAARLDDTALLDIDVAEHLLASSVQVLRLRDSLGPRAPILPPQPAPDGLAALVERFGGKLAPAQRDLAFAGAYAAGGQPTLAARAATQALQEAPDDLELQANARILLGAMQLRAGQPDQAQHELQAALDAYRKAARPDGIAAVQHNLGVALTVSGKAEEAGTLFASAASQGPGQLPWQVMHSLNPGIAAVTRPFGQVGLPLLVKDTTAGTWATLAGTDTGTAKQAVTVVRDGGATRLQLDDGAIDTLRAELYEARVNAESLQALDPILWEPVQFVAYLTHVQGFVLPLALGDTYAALGDFQKAITYYLKVRDYPFLNLPIERPLVWGKLARAHLQLATRLYRDRDAAGARAHYEQIVRIQPDGSFELSGALYEGTFAALQAETLAFLQATDPAGFTAIDTSRRTLLLEALTSLRQILAGINYLGFPDDIIPIHRWRYLQNVARYFANQAIQAERAYINFTQTAEREEFTRLALEQAVDAQAAALDVEDLRVGAAEAQLQVAELAADLNRTRRDNAVEQRNEYASVSRQLAYLDEITAFTNASGIRDTKIRINSDWASLLGVSAADYDPNRLIQLLTRQRSQLSRGYELHNMDRQVEELNGAVRVGDAQVQAAGAMVDVAVGQRQLAELRLTQVQAQLAFFNGQEFTPELWDNLAQAQRDISRRYLDWAISAAFLMERAFEYQYDTEVNRIRFDYERSELHGLLAGDFLLADIDSFSFDRLLETAKRAPVKVSIPLADRYPFQYYQQFQRTGRIDFQTLLDDFDRAYPGVHLTRIRRVEVVVEGLVGPDGLHGTLTNSGVTLVRDRAGDRRLRFGKPETLVLSRFDLRNDGFVFESDEDVLEVFEGSGMAGGWILEFPPDSNDVDYTAITNVHLVLYAEGLHSDAVANTVRAELAATAVYEYSLGLGLAFQFPDEFFGFQDTGTLTVTIDNAYLPFDHTDPVLHDLDVRVETTAGVPASGLTVHVERVGGPAADLVTDGNGMVSTGGTPLDVLRGQALLGDWTLRIDPAANPGFDPETVENLFLFAEYRYTPRGRPVVRDEFTADPLAQFEVVDDPQATFDAPSLWGYDPAGQRIRQTSNIHAPDGAANLNTAPNKPGTYLVRRESPQWPLLSDLVLRARVRSDDQNGIGLVVRYVDQDNFYFVLLDARRGYRRLGKKVNGVFGELDTPAVDTTEGYPTGQDLELTVAVVGDALIAQLDGTKILRGRDRSLPGPGRVGFYAWANPQAQFLDLEARRS